jgi:ubiquinone biosynthesis protein
VIPRALARAAWITALALSHAPAFVALRWRGDPRDANVLRAFFERAGGGFVKLGQLLAMRYDYLPERYCLELSRLLGELRPVPFERISAIVEAELGERVSARIDSIEPIPLATASLAQVHGAVLVSGERVVIKVLKPGIREVFRIDLALARLAGAILLVLPGVARSGLRSVLAEVRRQAYLELDLGREAALATRFHTVLAADRVRHRAPRVYRDLSGPSILTTERIDGVTVKELLDAVAGDGLALEELANRGVRPQATAIVLFHSILAQTMRHRLFNADPHASNVLVEADGTLVWVDFGLAGWLDERQWRRELLQREAFVAGDLHRMFTLALDALAPLPDRDLRSFEHDWKSAAAEYRLFVLDPEAPPNARSFARFMRTTLRSMRRHGLRMDASVLQLYRAIVISDVIILRLYPQIDWIGHLEAFLSSEARRLIRFGTGDRPVAHHLALGGSAEAAADTLLWALDEWPSARVARLHSGALRSAGTSSFVRTAHAASATVLVASVLFLVATPIAGLAGISLPGSSQTWALAGLFSATTAVAAGFAESAS